MEIKFYKKNYRFAVLACVKIAEEIIDKIAAFNNIKILDLKFTSKIDKLKENGLLDNADIDIKLKKINSNSSKILQKGDITEDDYKSLKKTLLFVLIRYYTNFPQLKEHNTLNYESEGNEKNILKTYLECRKQWQKEKDFEELDKIEININSMDQNQINKQIIKRSNFILDKFESQIKKFLSNSYLEINKTIFYNDNTYLACQIETKSNTERWYTFGNKIVNFKPIVTLRYKLKEDVITHELTDSDSNFIFLDIKEGNVTLKVNVRYIEKSSSFNIEDSEKFKYLSEEFNIKESENRKNHEKYYFDIQIGDIYSGTFFNRLNHLFSFVNFKEERVFNPEKFLTISKINTPSPNLKKALKKIDDLTLDNNNDLNPDFIKKLHENSLNEDIGRAIRHGLLLKTRTNDYDVKIIELQLNQMILNEKYKNHFEELSPFKEKINEYNLNLSNIENIKEKIIHDSIDTEETILEYIELEHKLNIFNSLTSRENFKSELIENFLSEEDGERIKTRICEKIDSIDAEKIENELNDLIYKIHFRRLMDSFKEEQNKLNIFMDEIKKGKSHEIASEIADLDLNHVNAYLKEGRKNSFPFNEFSQKYDYVTNFQNSKEHFENISNDINYLNQSKFETLSKKTFETFKLANNCRKEIYSPTDYIDHYKKSDIKNKLYNILKLEKEFKTEDLECEIQNFNFIYQNIDHICDKMNEIYIEEEMERNREFFNHIGKYSLDNDQRRAVVVNDINNQIIASAGSGKTLTLVAKIKYLIEKKGILPEEILCITYSNASKEDLERKLQPINKSVEVRTFHSLGNSFLDERPNSKAFDICFDNFILKDDDTIKKVLKYFSEYYFADLSDIKTLGKRYEIEENRIYEPLSNYLINNIMKKERLEYFSTNNKQSIRRDYVKSSEELMIANYLFLNNIGYEYEKTFPLETARGYKPDFYLGNNIYLEHFGVDKNCKTPQYNKKDSKKYKEDMAWKRKIFNESDSTLIETYSYYMGENRLTKRLEEKLIEVGIEPEPMNAKEVLEQIKNNEEINQFKAFKNLIRTFINLFKGNNYSKEKFKEFHLKNQGTENKFNKERNKIFLEIVEDFYNEYEEYLRDHAEIDFNDMVNRSAELIEKNGINHPYKHIIIDEYQDISQTRVNLIQAIQNSTKSKLTVVGDDWQSIYRFSGCNIKLFTHFHDSFENPEKTYLTKTYRNSQELIDISSDFIKKNDEQMKKTMVSKKNLKNPIRIKRYKDNESEGEALAAAIDEIVRLNNETNNEDGDILILTRNRRDIINYFETNPDFRAEKLRNIERINDYLDNHSYLKIRYEKNPSLNIYLRTVHSSKGLEEDNVIVLNLKNKVNSFPSQKTNDEVLSFVIDESDEYPFAEERRLFYVALTRTKNYTFLLAPKSSESVFIQELSENNIPDEELCLSQPIEVYSTGLKCPSCKTGEILIKRDDLKNSENYDRHYHYITCSHNMCLYEGGEIFGFKEEYLETLEFSKNNDGLSYIRTNPKTGKKERIDCKHYCKNCGSKLIVRRQNRNKNIIFYGCRNYRMQTCKYSELIPK